MGVNITLYFEQEVPERLVQCVEAKELCQGKTLEKIEGLCKELGVTGLMEYSAQPDVSHLPMTPWQAANWYLDGAWDESLGPEPETHWHDPAEGLATVRAVLGHMRDRPGSIRGAENRAELQAFEQALSAALAHGVRFHIRTET